MTHLAVRPPRAVVAGSGVRLLLGFTLWAAFGSPVAAHSPHEVVLEMAMAPRFSETPTLLAVVSLTEHQLLAQSDDGGLSWQHRDAPMLRHEVSCLRLSPAWADDRTAFAGTLQAGVWRSEDGGITWRRLHQGLENTEVRSLVVSGDYARDGRVVAVTANGVFVSRDRGESWRRMSAGLTETDLTWVEQAGDTLLAGRHVIHRSDDGGVHWAPVGVPDAEILALDVSAGFAADRTLVVALADGSVAVSQDAGRTFTATVDGLPLDHPNDVAFAGDGTLFLATTHGAYRADGPFSPWVGLSAGLAPQTPQTTSHYRFILPSETFGRDGLVFLGSFEGVYRSDERGDPWRRQDLYHLRVSRSLVLSPTYDVDQTLFMGTYGAAPLALEGQSWSARSTGIQGVSLFGHALALSPRFAADGVVFFGFKNLWRSSDRGQTWAQLGLSFLGPTQPHLVRALGLPPTYGDEPTVFLGAVNKGVWRSTNDGDDWMPKNTGLPAGFTPRHFVFSPDWSADRTLFVAGRLQGVYRSTDAGQSWESAQAGITDPIVRTIAISPDFPNDGLLFVGTSQGGLFRTDDRGESWTLADHGTPHRGELDVEGVVFSPAFASDRTAFLSTSRHGIHRTTDGGRRWDPTGTGLPQVMLRDLAISPSFVQDGTLVVSTHDWLWRSTDGGETWARIPGWLRVSDDHPTVFHDGAWQKVLESGVHGDGVRLGTEPGSSCELTFRGDRVSWFTTRRPDGGQATIELDGVPVATVDLFAPVTTAAEAWSARFDEVDWHTVRVVVSGAAGSVVADDGFSFGF